MTPATRPPYRGRFAPSPTGPLHLGSLVAALASFLDARASAGVWLLRIDDLDAPREQPGAADAILRALEALGLHWDERVYRQREDLARYDRALERLDELGRLFGCACTRRETSGRPYPGTCRLGTPPGRPPRSVRMRIPDASRVRIDDRIQGPCELDAAAVCGDFIVRRADGLHAYHLATVVDDAEQGITDIVRGADLLESTVPQRLLQDALGLPVPGYAHLATVCDDQGVKLSKQTGAAPVDERYPVPALRTALQFLGQTAPAESLDRGVLLAWAVTNWSVEAVPAGAGRPCDPAAPATGDAT